MVGVSSHSFAFFELGKLLKSCNKCEAPDINELGLKTNFQWNQVDMTDGCSIAVPWLNVRFNKKRIHLSISKVNWQVTTWFDLLKSLSKKRPGDSSSAAWTQRLSRCLWLRNFQAACQAWPPTYRLYLSIHWCDMLPRPRYYELCQDPRA